MRLHDKERKTAASAERALLFIALSFFGLIELVFASPLIAESGPFFNGTSPAARPVEWVAAAPNPANTSNTPIPNTPQNQNKLPGQQNTPMPVPVSPPFSGPAAVPTAVPDSSVVPPVSSPTPERIPFRPQGSEKKDAPTSKKNFFGTFLSMIGSLIIVFGAFFVLVYFLKKISPRQTPFLPKEVIESIGQYRLSARHQLYLLKFIDHYLLVSVTDGEVSLLSETITAEESAALEKQLRESGLKQDETNPSDGWRNLFGILKKDSTTETKPGKKRSERETSDQ